MIQVNGPTQSRRQWFHDLNRELCYSVGFTWHTLRQNETFAQDVEFAYRDGLDPIDVIDQTDFDDGSFDWLDWGNPEFDA